MSINVLDSYIINRISAGEVVESPFSIVKELLDNALDAGANKISVEIENGGIDYISVRDNGCGIGYDDIKKAFLPHATSKIKDVQDLESIATLGFRGEALASISNVSKTTLVTKRAEDDCAYMMSVNGGVFSEITPTTTDNGTKFEVSNLFFNTPARRKFLKKPKQEENQITNIIARYILSNPKISFKYVVDGKVIYKTHGEGLIDAIYCVYGNDATQNIVEIDKTVDNIKLHGYVSKIGYSKPNTTYQTLIVNGRYVIDEIVSKATYMAFEEYLMPRQFPFYVFSIDMPNIDVDVNVHPSKMNIKFSSPNKIYDLVYSAVRSSIYSAINPTKTNSNTNCVNEVLIDSNIKAMQEFDISPIEQTEQKGFVLKQESFSPITMFDMALSKDNNDNIKVVQNNVNITDTENKNNLDITNAKQLNTYDEQNGVTKVNVKEGELLSSSSKYINANNMLGYKVVGQLFNEFIVLEKDDNMILLDFHAGHERLNYDKFTKIVASRNVVVQDLLIPYTQEMTELELNFIMSIQDKLNELGFDISSISNKKLVINSVPMQLKDINLKMFVDDLLHDIKSINPSMNYEIKHYLMQKACKSSVKSGMTLSEMEINDLLHDLDMKNPVLLCPHGRPIITVVKRSQIEKWFKRIV